MQKLTILVDMDDVLENLCETWVAHLNVLFQTDVKFEDVKEWDMTKAFPMLTREEIFWPLRTELLWKKVKPLPDAQKYLKRLFDDGHKVLIVTASHPETVAVKLNEVLFKYFPFVKMEDVIVATQKWLIRGDVMVDDGPHNLKNFFGDAILFSQPHNRSFDTDMYGIKRAENWEEVYKMIQEIAQEEPIDD